MKKFLLGLVLLLSAACPLFGQSTNGFHRTAVALARAFSGVTAQVVPNAKVTVTATATGLAATIYSDPALSSLITPSVVTADNSGNYGYYIALGYCVTETITSPGQGTQVITNICNNSIVQGPTFQTNGVDNTSQTLLNHVDTATVKWTNTSGGVESASVPAATNSSEGVIQPDGTTCTVTSGVLTCGSGGAGLGLDCTTSTGADFGAKVQACMTTVEAAGGGIANAMGFVCPGACHIGTADLTVGDGTHGVTLLLPVGAITRDTVSALGRSAQVLYNSYSTIIGQGKNITVLTGPGDVTGFSQAWKSGGVQYANVSGLSVQATTAPAGSIAMQFGGANLAIPYANPVAGAAQMLIGAWANPDASGWPGREAQYAVYNYVLTPTQVANHYTVGSSGSGYETTITTDTPIIYYPMNETSGTVATDLISARNGTYSGGITLGSLSGIPGDTSCGGVCTAPVFDGTTGVLTAPSFTYFPTANWSIEVWLNTNTVDGPFKHYFESNAASCYESSSNGGIACQYPNLTSETLSGDGIAPGSWYHLVFTHSAAGIKGYINGVLSPIGTDVLNSTFSNMTAGGADIGTMQASYGGCNCYNKVTNVDSTGASIGVKTANFSGFQFGVNSDQWTGGRLAGPIGLFSSGTSKYTWNPQNFEGNQSSTGAVLYINPDPAHPGSGYSVGDTIKPNGGDGNAVLTLTSGGWVITTAGTGYANLISSATTTLTGGGSGLHVDVVTGAYIVELSGGGDYIVNPYEEAGATDYICGIGNSVVGSFLSSAGSIYSPTYCSGYNNSAFLWGAGERTESIGVVQYINMDAGGTYDPYLTQGGGFISGGFFPTNVWRDGPAFSGLQTLRNGIYGHAPWNVGFNSATGGSSSLGKVSYQKIANPVAPVLAAVGGTGTTYTYYLIGFDFNGGVTMPSSPATVSGPASLDATHYITITTPKTDGISCWDVLKGNTSTVLTLDGVNKCPNLTASMGFSTMKDTGQATSGFSAPSRNTTGDMTVQDGELFLPLLTPTDAVCVEADGSLGTAGCMGFVLPSQYKTWTCAPGIGDGNNVIQSGTYLTTTCPNETGVTITLTRLACFTDNAGSSTMDVANGAGTALLTGAVTCGTSKNPLGTAGTQSATTTLAAGDSLSFTFVADGTSKQSTWDIAGTY